MTELLIKRASWLELFYDLAYVALVAQLTYLAAEHHHTLIDFLNIFLIGYAIFISWWSTTANQNLKEREDMTDKLFVQLQMVGVFLMSITMPGVFENDATLFLGAYVIVRTLQLIRIISAPSLGADRRPQVRNLIRGRSIALGLWSVSVLLPFPYGYVTAAMALAVDVFLPLARSGVSTPVLMNVNHLQERLGLFLILVMGESMLVVALANSAASVGFVTPALIVSGLFMMIALWWIYFNHLEQCAEGLRPRNLFFYLHAHGFLFGSIILMAAGYKNMVMYDEIKSIDFIFVTLGLIGIAVTLAVIRNTLHGRLRVLTFVSMLAVALIIAIAAWAVVTTQFLVAVGLFTALMVSFAIIDVKALAKIMFRLHTLEDEHKDVGRAER